MPFDGTKLNSSYAKRGLYWGEHMKRIAPCKDFPHGSPVLPARPTKRKNAAKKWKQRQENIQARREANMAFSNKVRGAEPWKGCQGKR